MDPIFLNLGLQQHPTPAACNNIALATPSLVHTNGIPQESKLATYISNRTMIPQQSVTTTIQTQNDMSSPTHTNQILGQQNVLNSQVQDKSLVALGLDPVNSRKPVVQTFREFQPLASTGVTGLSHSASTPSFQQSFSSHSVTHIPSTSTAMQYSSSTMREQSPLAQASPARGNSAPRDKVGAADQSGNPMSTCHENVGGTTYFYTSPEYMQGPANNTTQASGPSVVFPDVHCLPPTPSQVQHLRVPTSAQHFFMNDELRQDIFEKQDLMLFRPDPEANYPDIPREIDMYHELVPLEPINHPKKSSVLGYITSVYKATHTKTGIRYCLYRIHNYRLNNLKVMQILDVWKKLQNSSLVLVREVFTTKDFGDNSFVFVYDYHPGSETIASKFFSNSATNGSWERHSSNIASSGNGQDNVSRARSGRDEMSLQADVLLSENTLWNYVIQLTGGIRAIHTQGLSCRTLEPSKILVTDNQSRMRINCSAIVHVLSFDPNAANAVATIQSQQQDDLVSLGKLLLTLACNSHVSLLRENLSTALELINRSYSRDFYSLLMCLLTAQRIKSINDVMPMIGARFYTALDSSVLRGDSYEAELWKELHNGRLFRLLTKINTIVDGPELNMDAAWSETGNRYMLKLFHNYIFHQHTESGQPWLDMGHIVTALNKLDSGSSDRVCLMSTNEQNVIVASYSELKKCIETSFDEILQATNAKNALTS